MNNQVTVLEGIIKDIGVELYQRWYNGMAIEDRTDEASEALGKNANETVIWVIQEFMRRFNQAADEIKNS